MQYVRRLWAHQGEKMNDKTYTIYKHVAPDGRLYIGITKNRLIKRWQGGSGYKGNTYFTRAIKKYGWDNFSHVILAEGLTEQQAKELEIKLIAESKSNQREYGFNISSGGESKSGTVISDWQKQRISEASKGRTVSAQTREKLSRSTSKKWADPYFVEHMREINTGRNNPQYGKTRTEEERLKRGAKPIIQYDLEGNFIAEYVSCHVASAETNISRDVISKCCKGIFTQGKGYVWKYKEGN